MRLAVLGHAAATRPWALEVYFRYLGGFGPTRRKHSRTLADWFGYRASNASSA